MKKNLSNYDLQVDMGRRIFLNYDQTLLIKKFSLEADAAQIYLTYLNTPIRISRADGRIEELRAGVWTACRNYSTVMTVYDLLCFHQGADAPKLLRFWEGDEEFPPKLQLLWDRNTDRFLHFETTFFLQGDLFQRLTRAMHQASVG